MMVRLKPYEVGKHKRWKFDSARSKAQLKLDEIVKNLYLGGASSRSLVTSDFVVLSICHCETSVFSQNPKKLVEFPIEDNGQPSDQDIAQFKTILTKSEEIIRQSLQDGHKVLIHCMAGRQRSAAVVAYYLAVNRFKGSVENRLESSIYHVMTKRSTAFRDSLGARSVNWYKAIEELLSP